MSTTENEEASKNQQLYIWKAPLTMCLSMMGGVGFAVGHHCFYGSLAGTPPSSETYYDLGGATSQQLNIALGTLLASMSKILLSIAISTAQEQHAWSVLKARPSKLRSIDGLLASKSNALNILDARLWMLYPLSMFLSLLFWLLPFATLLTPATLTVKAAVARSIIVGPVPSISFTNEAFARITVGTRTTTYSGPSDGVTRAALSSLISGTITPIASTYNNASWSLNFEAPALRCSALGADDELRINVTKSATERCSSSGYCYRYISWMPDTTTDLSPFLPGNKGATRDTISGPRDAPISLYVVENNDDGLLDSNMLVFDSFTKCTLYSASYQTEFSYRSGVQEISTITIANEPSEPWLQGVDAMSTKTFKKGVGVPFKAVMDAFSSMLIGSVLINRNIQGAPRIIQTQVGITNLAKNLMFFGKQSSNQPEAGHEIPRLLENMFLNTTLSLVSQAELNPTEPIQATIETEVYQNIYTYSVAPLWIAYGVAVGITILSITVGTWAVVGAGSSYSSKFSTILRLAFNVRLSEYVELQDTGGEDPLPDRLENTIVVFPSRNAKGAEVNGSLLNNGEERHSGFSGVGT
ncbi:het-r protein [Colletotrichum scovillei]|uniref:Het-r protein n=1 Tax=Colletotrichum scovillei TaxID=1209932 RepID=A0A9P7QYM2_9PEZI|nr:het-r protein [Colletotrichum scovillei]KAG7052732.1 het-r protein [Colletotrichum scovillei]KAG7065025.1 het-r protein [Colletotrichum scovillei]